MTRRSVLQLLASAQSWAQKPRAVPPAAPPPKAVIDAVVADSQGSTVRNLGPSDFALAVGRQQHAIASFAAIDAVTGAARAAAPLPLPMKIDPGDVHRTFAFVVDDAGMAAARIEPLREALLRFVNDHIGERDTVALFRTSSGTGLLEQVASDRARLRYAIGQLAFNPAAALPSLSPWPQTLHYALQGLRAITGRKAVVVVWERKPALANFDPMIALANRAWSSVYTIYAGEQPAPESRDIANLAASTGGLSIAVDLPGALDRILQDQASYYLLGFDADPSSAGRDLPVSVTLTRTGLELRSRLEPPVTAPPELLGENVSPQAELRRVLVSPLESGSMHVRVWPQFSRTTSSWIDVSLLIDPHDVAFTHKANGTHVGGLDFLVRIYDADGEIVADQGRAASLSLPADKYEELLKEGLSFSIQEAIPKPGVFQVFGAVRDATSGNTGLAHRLIEVPDTSRGDLTVTGVTLFDATETDSVRRVFRAGQPFGYSCSIFNAALDAQKQAQIEVRLTISSGGRAVYEGNPMPLTVADAANRQWLTVRGKLEMKAGTGAGDFVLQLTVTDKIKPRTASQWTEFTLR